MALTESQIALAKSIKAKSTPSSGISTNKGITSNQQSLITKAMSGEYGSGAKTYTQEKILPRIVSSTSALDQRDTNNAMNTAGGNLYGSNLSNIAMNNMTTGMSEMESVYKKQEDAIGMVFDAKLAQNNQQYASLMQDLEGQRRNQLGLAEQNAASLNPYSQARGAQTAKNFSGAINQKYNEQAIKIQQQADVAQQMLAAGEIEAYSNLSKNMADSNQKFRSEMLNFMQEQQKMQQQQSQWEAGYDLNVAQFGLQQDQYALSKETKATDDFRSWMTTLSGSPDIQNDIQEYFKSGTLSEGLKPIVKQAEAMGLSPQEALGIFQYQTDSVRKQQALEEYRNQQLLNAQYRMAQATDNQTMWQAKIAANQGVLQMSSDLMANGILPGTPEYAIGVARATSASPMSLPAGEVSKYTQMGVLSKQFSSLKSRVNSVNENSVLYNTLLKYAGKDISSVAGEDLAILNAQLTALSGTIGKTFYGESGNLSNSDIQRVLSALPNSGGTAAVRTALYNGMVDVAQQNAILTLQNHAANGYQVATYAHYVDQLNKEANASKMQTGSSAVMSKIPTEASDILSKYNIPLQ